MPSRGKGKGKYRSIKHPRMYRALKRKGFSKRLAAMISNAYMKRGGRIGGRKKRNRRKR